MALFKKKAATSSEPSQDYEETLLAEEPAPEPVPDEGAVLADDALGSEPAKEQPEPGPEPTPWPPEPEPEPEPGPEPEPEPEPEFPPDLEPHLKRSGPQRLLVEHEFNRPLKIDFEGKATPSPRASLAEKSWSPHRKTSLTAVHRGVDGLRVRKVRPVGDWLQQSFKPLKPATRRVEVIPPNILTKRIVYETEGGFVIEVTYREGVETRKKFFTVSSRGGRDKALGLVQSGKYAEVTIVGEDAIAHLQKPKPHAPLPTPPGKVNTYPITNGWDVSQVEGIGDVYARRLHELGIHSTDQLRLINAVVIANNVGTSPTTVHQWQQMSEFLCVKGIGRQYAEVLMRAGIAGVDELKKQKPKDLSERCNKVIEGHKPRIIGTKVQSRRAWGWILAARHMKKQIQGFPVFET